MESPYTAANMVGIGANIESQKLNLEKDKEKYQTSSGGITGGGGGKGGTRATKGAYNPFLGGSSAYPNLP